MIGMADGNSVSPVELFGEHGAQQLVRPGGGAKGDDVFGLLDERGIQPILSANGKNNLLNGILLRSLNELCEVWAGEGLAGGIHHEEAATCGQEFLKGLSFACAARVGGEIAWRIGDFFDGNVPARLLEVMRDEFRFRLVLGATNGRDRHVH